MNKRIALICGRTFTVIKFRKNLVKALQENNYDVSIIALDNDYEKEIKNWNVEFYYINQNNRSINPLKKIRLIKEISNILNIIKPDKVFTFMLTPNTFGVLAAHKSNIKDIYSMVEGAGDVFIYNTLKWKTIRFFTCLLLKKSFKYSKKVFFLNNDDKNEFIERKLVKENQCVVIPGIGVDTDYFAYKPIKNTNTFLMVARMMPSKGVIEYCEAARQVKKTHPDVIFNYIGEEFTLTKKDIQEYIDDESINYLGYIEDVRPYYEDCFVNVLPSYREGFGLVIAEAFSIGRISIATNCIGCRDVISDGFNGYVVCVNNSDDLVQKMMNVLKHKEKISQMSINARNTCTNVFDCRIVNNRIMRYLI